MISTVTAEKLNTEVGTTPTRLSARELGQIIGMTKRAIIKRSTVDNWPFAEVPSNGGLKKLFPLQTLPADIQRQVRIHYGELPEGFGETVPATFEPERVAQCSVRFECAREWQKELAQRRLDILKAWEKYRNPIKRAERTAAQADRRFVELYAEKAAPGLDPEMYRHIRKIKRSGLHEWAQRYAQEGIAGLVSHHGHNRGQTGIPAEQQHIILGTYQNNPNLKPEKIAVVLRGKFDGTAVCTRQVREFLRRQANANPQVFAFLKSPDEWRNKHQLSLGDASAKAKHFLHYIEVDSTKIDVLCDDNKRYTIIGGIDIFSRKCKFLVVPTSSSWGIAGLLRSIILDWGLPENLVRDNGKDYASDMIRDACLSLGIAEAPTLPFTPEAKPFIERVNKTLLHDLVETLPGYCGHNVAEAQAIRSRKSFAERFGKGGKGKISGEDVFAKTPSPHPSPKTPMIVGPDAHVGCGERSEPHQSGGQPNGNLTRHELQAVIDRWAEQVYSHRTHGSLGTSPNVKAASAPSRPRRIEDPRALDILLAPAPKGGFRHVLKKGIHLDNQLFWNDDLIPWIGRKVRVKYDISDAGRIFCFDPEFTKRSADVTDDADADSPSPQPSPSGRGNSFDFSPARIEGETKRGGTAFICEALDLSISGITVGEIIAARKRAKKQVMAGVKAMKILGSQVGDPLAEEIRQIREERATVTNLRVGDPVIGNPFVDAANAAAAAVRGQEEAEEENREGRFCKVLAHGQDSRVGHLPAETSGDIEESLGRPHRAPGPLPKNSQHWAQEEYRQRLAAIPDEPQDPKIIPFAHHQPQTMEDILFDDFIDRFEYLRRAQRERDLVDKELAWLRANRNEWIDYAAQFCEGWPAGDRVWLARIAPDRFEEYKSEEESR